MAILIDPNNPEAKERAKWEQHHTEHTLGGLQPGNPYVKREFPKMLVRAMRVPPGFDGAGKWACSLQSPRYFGFRDSDEWARACQEATIFTSGCQKTVNTEEEARLVMNNGEGWRESVPSALEYRAALETAISDAAAERHYRDSKMSAKAQAEALEHDRATFEHQPEVPAKPMKRRGRPPKNAAA